MKKVSYKNKRKERIEFLENMTISTPDESVSNNPTSGVTSNFIHSPLIKEEEVSEEIDVNLLKKIRDEYGESMSKDSYYKALDILLKKSAEKDYFQEMKDLISSIIDSNPVFYDEKLEDIISVYHSKYRESIRSNEEKPEKSAYLSAYQFYKKDLMKTAQYIENDPVYVAKQMVSIIDIMINRMKPESRMKSYKNLRDKLSLINPAELSAKKSPGGAAIGISISLVKNMLIARDPFFINVVLEEVLKRLKR
jgi:hypothetical protein